MPIYLYQCPVCEKEYEIIKGVASLTRQETCPKCENVDLERIMARKSTFKLKGGGWFKDDYTKKSKRNN